MPIQAPNTMSKPHKTSHLTLPHRTRTSSDHPINLQTPHSFPLHPPISNSSSPLTHLPIQPDPHPHRIYYATHHAISLNPPKLSPSGKYPNPICHAFPSRENPIIALPSSPFPSAEPREENCAMREIDSVWVWESWDRVVAKVRSS